MAIFSPPGAGNGQILVQGTKTELLESTVSQARTRHFDELVHALTRAGLIVPAAMIGRVVHHADVLSPKGASYRLRNGGIDTLLSIRTQDPAY
jgi:hypothetical protein